MYLGTISKSVPSLPTFSDSGKGFFVSLSEYSWLCFVNDSNSEQMNYLKRRVNVRAGPPRCSHFVRPWMGFLICILAGQDMFVGEVQRYTYNMTWVNVLGCDSSYVPLTDVLDNDYMYI